MNICKEKNAPCIFAQASGYCCSTVCLGRIETRPTVELKRGRWVYTEYENGDVEICCSECGEGVYNKTCYCPNCGAKMEK